MDDKELAEIRARCGRVLPMGLMFTGATGPDPKAEALCAAARDVEALLAEVERLRAEVKRIKREWADDTKERA